MPSAVRYRRPPPPSRAGVSWSQGLRDISTPALPTCHGFPCVTERGGSRSGVEQDGLGDQTALYDPSRQGEVPGLIGALHRAGKLELAERVALQQYCNLQVCEAALQVEHCRSRAASGALSLGLRPSRRGHCSRAPAVLA
eukprot:TRINITY_DN26272_c0_g1_i1.p1 TRINITY_DN26272_c0_g1~~TRINITY_DN26272_c0_g1_i1.p1  ORF type:complete len:160 (+),score=11.46 TRINITY_DN26272_c0_g1_i1:62-481(+)